MKSEQPILSAAEAYLLDRLPNKVVRYVVEQRSYTALERFRIWFYEARIAILRLPPRHYSLRVLVRPGEPGYDTAPYEQVVTWGSEIFLRSTK